jgi:hypothetical protein
MYINSTIFYRLKRMKDAWAFSTSEYMIQNLKEMSGEKTLMKKQSGSGK